ncbi:hypothetical protein AYI69_g9259 [Smittium culicis]|uniref:CCHC-type domain-containing protein n=1 Tax=Smittium culicis TaxID=133412 RepID=A0A1R1XDV2_9FUNG|nr:hypothetical protein AYI69_g9259 [Smittium culicis]
MVIRKPLKRARTLFSYVLKGDDPQYPTTEVQNSYVGDYPRYNSQNILKHDSRSDTRNKKMQKYSAKKIPAGKKGILMDMSRYKEVFIKHMLFGGEMTCLEKFCTGGSDMKVGCTWAQFKGDHIDALEVVFTALKDVSYIRQDDHRAGTKYTIFNNKEDADSLMATLLVYNDKPIALYQTVKIEEDITVVNIPNFRDVGIEPMRRFDNNQYIPHGIKVLVKKYNMKDDLPSFLDHENGKINIFYKGCKEACSYCKEAGHWKSKCLKIKKNLIRRNATENIQDLKFRFNSSKAELPPVSADPKLDDSKSEAKEAQPSKQPVEESKKIKDTEVSANDEAVKAKPSTINRLRGTVGLKKPPASSIAPAEIPSSPIEKVSSGDDTESDGINEDNNQPKIKRTTKSTINSDDFSDILMDSDMSSPMEIKKDFIPSNPNPTNNSNGYSPPSEHVLMAAKARMGQISEQVFNKFVTNVDKAPSGSSRAAIEPETEAEHHDISDIEF